MSFFKTLTMSAVALGGLAMVPSAALAQAAPGGDVARPAGAAFGPTYADLATLADAAELVLRVQIRKATVLRPERAPGVAPGFARLYVEANTWR